MEYSDLCFNNVQLMKLVSSAEIIFRHLCDLVPTEHKHFIDQWFCYKQEFDETCTNNSQFDVNEKIRENPVLARIDEVSENEKISSSSSLNSSVSVESEQKKESISSCVSNDSIKSSENTFEKDENQESQLDSELFWRMTRFKEFSDELVSEWFKTVSFSTSEIREYLNWLENEDYKLIWDNIYNASYRRSKLFYDHYVDGNQVLRNHDYIENRFAPAEVYHIRRPASTENNNFRKSNSPDICVDEQIRHLYKVRNDILQLREQFNKLKKDEIQSSADLMRYDLKIHAAFEIIDISIEMKNQLKMGRIIQDFDPLNDKVHEAISDCLCVLSMRELRHLLLTYLNNIIDMRKTCSDFDKERLQLENEISVHRCLIWKVYYMHREEKRVYESRCLTLHKQFEQKLHLIRKTTTDESNDESLAGLSDEKLLSITEKNDPQSDLRGTKQLQDMVACSSNIPEKSWKTLHNAFASSGTKVTLKRKKLIIETQKH